jgi:actin-related protein 5
MVELEEYKMLMSERSSMKKPEFMSRLVRDTPFDTEAELDSWIKKTEADIKRKEKKDMGEEEVEEDPVIPSCLKKRSRRNADKGS